MYNEIITRPIEIVVKRGGEEIALKMNFDSTLGQYYDNFIVILKWLTFINPEQILLLAGTEEFDEYIEAMKLANEEEDKILNNIFEKEKYNPYDI